MSHIIYRNFRFTDLANDKLIRRPTKAELHQISQILDRITADESSADEYVRLARKATGNPNATLEWDAVVR